MRLITIDLDDPKVQLWFKDVDAFSGTGLARAALQQDFEVCLEGLPANLTCPCVLGKLFP